MDEFIYLFTGTFGRFCKGKKMSCVILMNWFNCFISMAKKFFFIYSEVSKIYLKDVSPII